MRSEESQLLGWKKKYDRVGSADRLESNSMLPFQSANRKLACTKHVSRWSQ